MSPELNIAALNQDKDKELILYYLLRAITIKRDGGSGWLKLDNVRNILVGPGKLYTRAAFYKHLRLGDGKLWEVRKLASPTIKIYAPQFVCEYLATLGSKWVSLPWGEMPASRSLQKRRGVLYRDGAHKPMLCKARPVSRASLEEKTGISRRQQQRYDAAAGTTIIPTRAKYRDKQTHKLRSLKQKVIVGKGLDMDMIEIPRQLGNIYYSKADIHGRGVFKEIRKAFRTMATEQVNNKGISSKTRRYFDTVRDFVRANQQGVAWEQSFIPLKRDNSILTEVSAW